jgi:regulator of protease activity HflC (stomatin/prohibitin superfamily)
VDLDTLLGEREKLNKKLQEVLDEHTGPWGIKVTRVEVKQVELPPEMIRAIAKQAEAEREKRAKIIHADGELEASRHLTEAATMLGGAPSAITLRYLQTLTEIGVEKNTTIVFPVPMDLLQVLSKMAKSGEEK